MSQKIVIKKKAIRPIILEGDDQSSSEYMMIDHRILPIANGPFSSKMRGGLSISVAKSGYQKSIRRGYYHLANVFGLLWYEVGALHAPLMSNLINRLIIIASEDCAANLTLLHWIDQKVNLLRQKKISGSLTAHDISLITTVMVKAPKTRVSSWAKAVFYDALSHPVVSQQVEALYPGICGLSSKLDQIDRWEAYQDALSSVYPLLSIRYAMMAHIKEEKAVIASIWKHLLKVKNDKHTQLLSRWYSKEKNENRIYLVLAHIYICHPDWFQIAEIDESSVELMMNEWNHVINHGEIRIPSWMVDMHTYEGKIKGMNSQNFSEVGSHIENMWMPLCHPDWIKIYQATKTVSPQISTPKVTKITVKVKSPENKIEVKIKPTEDKNLSKEIVGLITSPGTPRGQLVTASYKPYVYLPRELPECVFKGPFQLKREPKLIMLKKRHEAFKILGSSVIDLTIMKDESQLSWVKYQNLATVSPNQWQTIQKHDKINNLDVEIIVRESLGFSQLSKLPVDEIEKILFDGDQPFYLTFLDAALFDCGDMGDHNTLVSNGIPYLIDYDDSTTRTNFQNYYDVYRKTSISQKKLFDRRVPTIMNKIIAHIDLYKEKQQDLEKILGIRLNKNISEIETVYHQKK